MTGVKNVLKPIAKFGKAKVTDRFPGIGEKFSQIKGDLSELKDTILKKGSYKLVPSVSLN